MRDINHELQLALTRHAQWHWEIDVRHEYQIQSLKKLKTDTSAIIDGVTTAAELGLQIDTAITPKCKLTADVVNDNECESEFVNGALTAMNGQSADRDVAVS